MARMDPAEYLRSDGARTERLTEGELLHPVAPAPRRGWRRLLLRASGGALNLGPSTDERSGQELAERIRRPLADCHRVAVLSLKGGVGKTTTCAALGATFASLRGDRVLALDANPDRGTLADRIDEHPGATVRDLLAAADDVRDYAHMRPYTTMSPSRLEVLASSGDPAVSVAFSEQDYRRTMTVLERFYNLVLTDCGTGLLHSAMRGVLELADQLLIVSSPSVDGARSASATLDWLEAHGYDALAAGSVTVLSAVRPGSSAVDLARLEDHFGQRTRAVRRIPYDRHLRTGAEIDLDRLAEPTRQAYRELAAVLADGFAS